MSLYLNLSTRFLITEDQFLKAKLQNQRAGSLRMLLKHCHLVLQKDDTNLPSHHRFYDTCVSIVIKKKIFVDFTDKNSTSFFKFTSFIINVFKH